MSLAEPVFTKIYTAFGTGGMVLCKVGELERVNHAVPRGTYCQFQPRHSLLVDCNFRLPLDPLLFPVTFVHRVAFLTGPRWSFRCNAAEKQIIIPLVPFTPKESALDSPRASNQSFFRLQY